MSIKSKVRDWIFPSKDDSFDDSYDYLLDFFNTLDEEFGGVIDFLFDRRITKFFRTAAEIDNTSASVDDLGLYIKTGDVYQYTTENTWVKIDRIGRLPKIRQRDPDVSDIGYDSGETWINAMSGHSFRLIGDIVIDENTNETEALWCDQNGQVNSKSKVLNKFYFYPSINLRYKTKTLHQLPEGGLSFEDELFHLEGSFNEAGIGQYLEHDTHMDIFIQDQLLGTLLIKRSRVQTLMDLDMFAPEGGLPAHNDSAIYPWYQKFERLLSALEISSITNDRLSKTLKGDMIFNVSMFEIITDPLAFNQFFDDNNHLMIPEPEVIEIKERYRSFFSALHEQEMTMDQKEFAIYLLGVCVAWQAYDGNIYYIDGNTMLADGNVLPTC